MWNERGARAIGLPPVAGGRVASTNRDLADLAGGNTAPSVIENQDVGIRDWIPTWQHTSATRRCLVDEDVRVVIQLVATQRGRKDAIVREPPPVRVEIGLIHRLAVKEDEAHARKPLGAGQDRGQPAELRYRRAVDGDVFLR